MPDQVKKYTDPMKARWDILTPPQRYRLIGVIAVVLIALVITVLFVFRTPWMTIASREDMRTIQPMVVSLNNAGIRTNVINYGSALQVDARRWEEAMGIINSEGVAPNSDHFTWETALDTGLGTTDDERRRRDILGMQGQIASQLTMMDGIENARVSLSVPTYRPFDRNRPEPSASVVITVSRDFAGAARGRELAMVVARNVARLEPERVMIVDHQSRTVWDGAEEGGGDPVNDVHQMREALRNRGVTTLRQNWSLIFDDIDVVFNTVFDETISRIEELTIYTPSLGVDGRGIPHTDEGSIANVEGGAGGIEPGIAPNAAVVPGYILPGGGVMNASTRDWSRRYHVDSATTIIQTGPGGMDTMNSTAAVTAVVERHVPQALWMSSDPDLTQEDWERFKMNNTMPTPLSDFEDFETFHALAAAALGIPVANVQLVILERIIPHDLEVRVWDIPTILMVAVLLLLIAMLLFGLLRRQRAAGEDEESLEPQLAVEDLLVSTQLDEAREEAAQELEEIDYFKENEIKKHIEKFVNEKPESVAALLRNWINVEEW